jgi:CBS domain containing-hemolysin-like protein
VALLIARPFNWFLNTLRWAIDLLDASAERIVRALGVLAPHSHTLVRSVEELLVMVQQARDRGLIPAAEARFVQNAIDLGRVQAHEVMVPRPDVHALPVEASFEDVTSLFATTRKSRLPVYEGTLDHILGFVHIKDVAWNLFDETHAPLNQPPNSAFQLRAILREVLIVPENKRVGELLVEFRSHRTGMAMVVDEFGSILGLITLEDILEQLVGEIHDEFDVVERPLAAPDGGMIFDAATKVRDLQTQYNIALPDDSSYETIGGFVLSRLGLIPRGGESFDADGYNFTVLQMARRRVSRVKIKPLSVDRSSSLPGAKPSAKTLTSSQAEERSAK